MIAIYFIIAFVLVVVDYRISHGNMGVRWNGYGSIEPILCGLSKKPMQYRVLSPWLTGLFGGGISSYLFVKYLSLLVMLFGAGYWFSVLGIPQFTGVFLLSVFLSLTIFFDYFDSYWEIGLLALSFGCIEDGRLVCLFIVTFLAALNRESAIIILFVLIAKVMMWPSTLALLLVLPVALLVVVALTVGLGLPRLWYGRKERYCHWHQFQRNIRDMRMVLNPMSGYFHSALILSVFLILSVINWGALPVLQPYILTMALYMILVSIPGVWGETRIYAPLLLTVIPLILVG